MHCNDVENVLIDHVEETMTPDAQKAVEDHLETCASCSSSPVSYTHLTLPTSFLV